jgi:hypothetical protein
MSGSVACSASQPSACSCLSTSTARSPTVLSIDRSSRIRVSHPTPNRPASAWLMYVLCVAARVASSSCVRPALRRSSRRARPNACWSLVCWSSSSSLRSIRSLSYSDLAYLPGADRRYAQKIVPPRCANSRGRGPESMSSRRVGSVSRPGWAGLPRHSCLPAPPRQEEPMSTTVTTLPPSSPACVKGCSA